MSIKKSIGLSFFHKNAPTFHMAIPILDAPKHLTLSTNPNEGPDLHVQVNL